MEYRTSHLWEKGARQNNEDSLALMSVRVGSTPAIMAVIADGIGGLSSGDVASSVVTYRLKSTFEACIRRHPLSLKRLRHSLMRELYCCHRDLSDYGSRHGIKLGTTCSLICMYGRHGFALHIGDSHIYHFRHGHSTTPRLIGTDHIDSFRRLTRCIGSGTFHRVQYNRIWINTGDTLLLCTDGYYHKHSNDNKTAISVSLVR